MSLRPSRNPFDFRGAPGNNRTVNSLAFLAAVNLVIWVGLFLYLWRLDRKISQRERSR
jgi:CcmD family protein